MRWTEASSRLTSGARSAKNGRYGVVLLSPIFASLCKLAIPGCVRDTKFLPSALGGNAYLYFLDGLRLAHPAQSNPVAIKEGNSRRNICILLHIAPLQIEQNVLISI